MMDPATLKEKEAFTYSRDGTTWFDFLIYLLPSIFRKRDMI